MPGHGFTAPVAVIKRLARGALTSSGAPHECARIQPQSAAEAKPAIGAQWGARKVTGTAASTAKCAERSWWACVPSAPASLNETGPCGRPRSIGISRSRKRRIVEGIEQSKRPVVFQHLWGKPKTFIKTTVDVSIPCSLIGVLPDPGRVTARASTPHLEYAARDSAESHPSGLASMNAAHRRSHGRAARRLPKSISEYIFAEIARKE